MFSLSRSTWLMAQGLAELYYYQTVRNAVTSTHFYHFVSTTGNCRIWNPLPRYSRSGATENETPLSHIFSEKQTVIFTQPFSASFHTLYTNTASLCNSTVGKGAFSQIADKSSSGTFSGLQQQNSAKFNAAGLLISTALLLEQWIGF